MKSPTIMSLLAAILIIFGTALYISQKKGNESVANPSIGTSVATTTTTKISTENVSLVNGVQIIKLEAKGGYSPRTSVAQAGVPTIIRFDTNNTFDCSRSVRLPSLNISKILDQTGEADIDIGSQPVGLFRGSCGMGMYPFEVDFQ